VLETARHIEYVASAECNPVILPKPLDLSFEYAKGFPFCMAVKRHNHSRGNGAPHQTIILVAVRHPGKELNEGAEHVKDLVTVYFAECRFEVRK
jgi:hypothetical protein